MLNERKVSATPMKTSLVPWLICGVGMLYYCFNYFLRVSPSVMQNELMQNFHINAYQFGHLAAFYYYAYTPMQIPAGMIYDKYGARFVLFCACLTAVVGLGVFITAGDFATAAIGRFLIGLGTAFAYIGTLKLASIWLPANRFATVAGLTTAFGMTSAIFSQNYLTQVVQVVGYQQALYSIILIGLVLSVVMLCCIRNRPQQHPNLLAFPARLQSPLDMKHLLSSLKRIATNSQMWIIGLVSCLTYLPASVFLDLWGIPYLKAAHHLTPEQAAYVSSMAFMGWILSGPTIGALSDKIKRRRPPLIICSIFGTSLLTIIFYLPGLSFSNLATLFFILGFSCGAHPICFALGKENNSIQISGTAVAVTNMLTMVGGAVFQPLVGKLLDWHAMGEMIAGTPVYSAADYTFALSIMPVCVGVGSFLCFFLKETYGRQAQGKVSEAPIYGAALRRRRLASEGERA